MARVTYREPFDNVHGTLGTSSRLSCTSHGDRRYVKRPYKAKPRTGAYLDWRKTCWTRVQQYWRTLSKEVVDDWNSTAARYTKYDCFGRPRPMTGHEMFVERNMYRTFNYGSISESPAYYPPGVPPNSISVRRHSANLLYLDLEFPPLDYSFRGKVYVIYLGSNQARLATATDATVPFDPPYVPMLPIYPSTTIRAYDTPLQSYNVGDYIGIKWKPMSLNYISQETKMFPQLLVNPL